MILTDMVRSAQIRERSEILSLIYNSRKGNNNVGRVFNDNNDNIIQQLSPRSTPRGDEEKSIVDICHTGCEQQH